MQVSGFRIYFLEPGYFFSIILSEFLKNRVALHKKRRKQSPPNEKKKELGTMSDYRLGVLGGMGPQATNTFY